MAQETAIVDKLLTNISQKVMPQGFIADKLLPVANVVQFSGKLGRYGKKHLRIETTLAGGEKEYARISTNTRDSDSYQLEHHGLSELLTMEDYANVEQPFDAEADATVDLTTMMMLSKEKGLADSLTDTNVLTNNVTLSGNDQLSDFTNSDPLDVFSDARNSVYSKTGVAPDTAVMSWEVFNKLSTHPKILESLGFTQNRSGSLTLDEMAKAIGVQRVEIGAAVFNSANEGQADVISSLWGKHIVLGVFPSVPTKRQVTLGYQIRKSGMNLQVFKNDENKPPESKLIQVRDVYQQLITEADAGYLIKDAIA